MEVIKLSNYNLLKTISKNYEGKEVHKIAASLGMTLKTEKDAEKDFLHSDPLKDRDAILTLAGSQYVIYYKSGIYEDFFILHEICHYLLKHYYDGDYEENQANILACMILIPKKELKNDMLVLSYKYNIPPHIAYKSIPALRKNKKPSKRLFTVFISIGTLALIVLTGFIVSSFFDNNTNTVPVTVVTTTQTTETSTITELTTEQLTTATETTVPKQYQETVYITRSGKKYHKSDCFYISGRDTTSVTVEEAEQQGYSPCSVCFN